jgi:4a-hydroxytetrahydrobiopterin dehydratase
VLGYDVDDDAAVVDPDGRQVELWFQQTDEHQEPRQRFHVDVSVPPDQAQARIEAALAAGGTLVSDDRAPAFTVLADPEGNKVCVCTWQGREPD